jgi:3-oxo-5-alpha-steroid 4-dehydrogenase 3
MAVAVPAFLFAWVNQYRCHKHLAGLKKYSLPEDGMFRHFICPHYTCECLLYFSMAVATAPTGAWCNRTLLCALVFVTVNLGVTASGTRKWYAEKFGIGPVASKWNMIPFVF